MFRKLWRLGQVHDSSGSWRVILSYPSDWLKWVFIVCLFTYTFLGKMCVHAKEKGLKAQTEAAVDTFHYFIVSYNFTLLSVWFTEQQQHNQEWTMDGWSACFVPCRHLTTELNAGRRAVPGVERRANVLPVFDYKSHLGKRMKRQSNWLKGRQVEKRRNL